MSATAILMEPSRKIWDVYGRTEPIELADGLDGKGKERKTKDNFKIFGMSNREDDVMQRKVGLKKEVKNSNRVILSLI